MILAGLDLGSRYVAIVAAVGPLPISALDAETIEVDPLNPSTTADELIYFLEGYGPSIVVIEWGRFYVSPKDDPRRTATTASAIGNARDVMQEIRIPFESKCRELGIEIVHVQAVAWRSRIKAKNSDIGVREAIAGILGESLAANLKDEHQRDACGPLLGYLMSTVAKDKPSRDKKPSAPKPERIPPDLSALATASKEEQPELARQARQNGATWLEIGAALGITKQAANHRFGPDVLPEADPTSGKDRCGRVVMPSVAFEQADQLVDAIERHNASIGASREAPLRQMMLGKLMGWDAPKAAGILKKSNMAEGRIARAGWGLYQLTPIKQAAE